MFKKSVILLVVMVMLFSFSAAVLAGDKEETGVGQAPKNKAGVRILVDENNDGVNEIHFLDAVNDKAKEEDEEVEDPGNSAHPDNPILVAGN